MDSKDKNFLIGALFGFLTGFFLFAMFGTRDVMWRKEAVQHGAAEYNSVTGEFQWKNKPEASIK